MIANVIGFGFLSGGNTPPVVPTPAEFYHDTITVGDGSANAFVYAPEGYDNVIPDGGWPLIICFQGDGGTYTVRLYANSGVGGFGTAQTMYVDLNGSVTSTYTITNTLIGYREYTGVPHTALAQFDVASTSGNPYLTIMEIYLHP